MPPTPAPVHAGRPWLFAGLALLLGALVAWLLLRSPPKATDTLDPIPPRPPTSARAEGPLGAAPTSAAGPGAGTDPSGLASRPPPAAPEVRGHVLDVDQRPVVGAEVTLHLVDVGAQRGLAVEDGEELGRARSGDDGSFALAAPTAGLARARARAPGLGSTARLVTPAGARLTLVLAREALLDVVVLTHGARPRDALLPGTVEVEAAGTRRSLALNAGRARVEGLSAGQVRVRVRLEDGREGAAGPLTLEAGALREVAVLVGTPARLGGEVRTAEGDEPLADASVIVAAPGRKLAEVRTDAGGRFGPLAVGLPGESVQVSVVAAGRQSALVGVPSLPEGPEPLELVVPLEAADPWRGRVERPDGTAAPGVEVGYTSDGVPGRIPARTHSDDEGRFELPPPPPPAPGRRVVLRAEGADGQAALALRPDTPRPEPLVLRLAGGATLRARVRDGHGRALEGALLRAQPAWDELRRVDPARGEAAPTGGADLLHALNAQGGSLSGLSDAAGVVEVRGLAPGAWRVVLGHEGQSRDAADVVRVAGEDVDLGELHVGAGLVLEGEVVGSDGRPREGVRVRATPPAGASARPWFAQSDMAGRFRFTDLPPGRTLLEVDGAGGPAGRAEVALPTAERVRLEVAGTGRIDLAVAGPEGPFDGWLTLVLQRPRQPEGSAWRQTVRAEQGRALFSDVPAGTWSPRVEADALLGSPAEALRVEPALDARARVELRAPARLEGTLRTAAGEPVLGGEVVLQDLARQGSMRAVSDAEGRWRLEGRAPGEHTLTARGPGGAEIRTRVTLDAGRTATLDLVLAPAGTLTLHVLDEQGRPVAGALVAVRPQQAGTLGAGGQGRSDARGRVTLHGLAVAGVVASARTRDGRTAQQLVDVVAQRTLEVELRLRRP